MISKCATCKDEIVCNPGEDCTECSLRNQIATLKAENERLVNSLDQSYAREVKQQAEIRRLKKKIREFIGMEVVNTQGEKLYYRDPHPSTESKSPESKTGSIEPQTKV